MLFTIETHICKVNSIEFINFLRFQSCIFNSLFVLGKSKNV